MVKACNNHNVRKEHNTTKKNNEQHIKANHTKHTDINTNKETITIITTTMKHNKHNTNNKNNNVNIEINSKNIEKKTNTRTQRITSGTHEE